MTPRDLQGLVLAAALAAVSVLGGCAPRSVVESPADPPQLRAIRGAYTKLVEEARHDPTIRWHSGWAGNFLVNQIGGRNRGLCYQWQEYIYLGLEPLVRQVGWEAAGLAVNEGNGWEHHCVIVWDPTRIRADEILSSPPPRPVYALDAWHDGEPDVHWIDDWLDSQPRTTPPRLQMLPVPAQARPKPGVWEGAAREEPRGSVAGMAGG